METKHGMRIRPGQPYQSFHTICYNFVVGDAEGYNDKKVKDNKIELEIHDRISLVLTRIRRS